jgi:2,4-dichlorophenol 6-monooxygenase
VSGAAYDTDVREARDVYGNWYRVSEIEEDGCLLVRPDGYVAWRCPTAPGPVEEARAALGAALGAIRHRS